MIQKEGYNVAKLSATSSLDGYEKEIGTIRLREISNQSLIAMAIPLGEEAKFKNTIKNTFGLKMPSPNKSVKNKDTRILSTQPDQIFVLTKRTDDPEKSMAIEIGKNAYITDQTDAWVILEISGSSSREALERICQLDLDKEVFQLDGMARTSMEHMSAIIIRKADDTFYLMSASSSAKSFLHAVELSANHVS
jgi:sarcosine oxidase subunit gamma